MKTILFILCSLATALFLGFVAFGIQQLFWLIIIFTLGLSFIAVISVASIAELLKYKNQIMIAVFSFICCCLAFVSIDFYQYIFFIKDVKTTIEKSEEVSIGFSDAAAATNAFLKDETGHSGLWGFLHYESKMGVSFLMPNKEVKGDNAHITYWGVKIIEAFMVFVIACISLGTAKREKPELKQ